MQMIESYQEQQRRIVNQLKNSSPAELPSQATIVPMRADYTSDPALCLTSVVFLPMEIGQSIYQTIVEPLRAIEPEHHYYQPEAMHLTIKNIRNVHYPPRFTQIDIDAVDRLFSQIIPRYASFVISLEELVPFTTSVSLIGYSDQRLGELVQALDTGLKQIGLPDDRQYFSDQVFFGNVTLCRFVCPPSARFFEKLTWLATVYQGQLPVKQIDLITCNAVCLPEARTIWHSYLLHD